MSEYTDGILFLARNRIKIASFFDSLSRPYFIHTISEKWQAFLPRDSNPEDEKLRRWMLEASKKTSLLYFQHPEDFGWGYNIFRDGQEVANLWVSYDLDWNMTHTLLKKRHPEMRNVIQEISPEIWEGTMREVLNSVEFQSRVIKQFAQANVDELETFEVTPEPLNELKTLLNADWYLKHKPEQFSQVGEFKRILGIQEMQWISYDYLKNEEK